MSYLEQWEWYAELVGQMGTQYPEAPEILQAVLENETPFNVVRFSLLCFQVYEDWQEFHGVGWDRNDNPRRNQVVYW